MDRDELRTELANLKATLWRTQIFFACFGLAVAFFATYDKFSSRRELKSHSLRLVNAAGREVVAISPQGDGACMSLYGTSKQAIVDLCSADSLGSYVSLVARNGETQAILSTGETTTEPLHSFPPGLVVSTQNGQKMFSVRLGTDSKLILGDASGAKGVMVLVPDGGQPTLKASGQEIFPASNRQQSSK
jgi:hypothetical protein